VRPIFYRGKLAGYAANKAHHADVGGTTPGSMPVEARSLFDEGVVVAPSRLVREDRIQTETVAIFQESSRTPAARGGAPRAQIAGNCIGERRLLELCERYGIELLDAALERSMNVSERRMRAMLRSLREGTFEVTDYLEDRGGEPSTGMVWRLPR